MDSTDNSSDVIIISSGIHSDTTMNSSSITSPITINLNNYTYTTSTSIDSIDLNNITLTDTIGNWSFVDTVPFENGFPEWSDFQEMCKEYPGLEKSFEHLKVFYNLCKSEWEAKKRGDAEQ